jgi:hypothetical protein
MDAVLRLLRGERLETLSRELGMEAHRLAAWRDDFLQGGREGLKGQRKRVLRLPRQMSWSTCSSGTSCGSRHSATRAVSSSWKTSTSPASTPGGGRHRQGRERTFLDPVRLVRHGWPAH